jgi:fumarate reductase subunit D
MMTNMDSTRKRSNTSSGDNSVTLRNVTIHGSRTNMKAQQQLMASVSPPLQSKYYCSARRAICSGIMFLTCIYVDVIASNVATNRWNTKLSNEQKAMPLPDILHDSFELPNAEHIIHELLRELPLALLVAVLLFGFVLPYDVMGRRNGKLMKYRRYEACTRYFETRCVLELMRALSVWVTTQADPHGLHCMNIEAHTIDDIFTNFTFARCGDNLYSGHASNLLSFALSVQTYYINLILKSQKDGSVMYRQLLATFALWITVIVVGFYIIISRMHYTVDVLMSFFLVPSVWLAWSNVSWPTKASSASNFKACKKSFLDLAEAN